jgi:uncharacterized protein (TIGR01777 family)
MNGRIGTEPGQRRVAISGAGGLIGRRLTEYLRAQGWQVARFVRRPATDVLEIPWEPAAGLLDSAALAGLDGVVHLAGESVAAGRWNATRRAAILDSRVRGTELLCGALARLAQPPRVLIAASAVGYYGDRGDELLTEESSPGAGFLADVCRQWEAACQPARDAGIRVVNLRIGMVLARDGGALARLLTPFRLGLGGRLGNGRQYMSWITREDLVRAMAHLLCMDTVAGPVNGVAPEPVSNAEFTRTLGHVLRRPTFCRVPAAGVRLLMGQMGRELLLASTRAVPERLTASSFVFKQPHLEAALRTELAAEES